MRRLLRWLLDRDLAEAYERGRRDGYQRGLSKAVADHLRLHVQKSEHGYGWLRIDEVQRDASIRGLFLCTGVGEWRVSDADFRPNKEEA